MICYPIQAAGIGTRVLASGDGEDPVVLIHGVGARADRWRRNLDAFGASGFHAFAIDLPGHGLADKGPAIDYTVPAYSLFVSSLLPALSDRPATLIGTSLGGHIAARVACIAPDLIRDLVLVGSVGITPLEQELGSGIAALLRDRSKQGIDAKLRSIVADESEVTEEWVLEEYLINNSAGAEQSFDQLAQYFEDGLNEHVAGPMLAAAEPVPPTLLVWGSNDRAVPVRYGHQAKDLIPGSQLALINGAGHAPYFERPVEFNETVTAFLRTLHTP